MKTLIVDDHAIVAQGLSLLLSGFSDIEVIGVAKSGEEALTCVRERMPELVFLDLYLGDSTGLNITRRLIHMNPAIKIIIITSELSSLLPFRLLGAGALGYLHKSAEKDELKRAIDLLSKGERYITPMIAQHFVLSKGKAHASENSFAMLSKRELEVMLMMVRGISAQEIAAQLNISAKTVHSHRANILEKMGVRNDVELTIKAIQEDVINVQSLPVGDESL